MAGDYEKSYWQFERTIELDPSFALSHGYFAQLLAETGRFEQAIEENRKAELLSGIKVEDAAAEAAARLKAFKAGGEKGYWQYNLQLALQAINQTGEPIFASAIAASYAKAGETDKAFEWLEKAYEAREGQEITLLIAEPTWKPLRVDPRFAAFQRRLGLPE